MSNIKKIQKAVKQYDKVRKEALSIIKESITEVFKDLFIEFPEVNNLWFNVNNHEFNDGDATYFSISYEEFGLNGDTYDDYDIRDGKVYSSKDEVIMTEKRYNKLSNSISEIFSSISDFDEELYGNVSYSLDIEREFLFQKKEDLYL